MEARLQPGHFVEGMLVDVVDVEVVGSSYLVLKAVVEVTWKVELRLLMLSFDSERGQFRPLYTDTNKTLLMTSRCAGGHCLGLETKPLRVEWPG